MHPATPRSVLGFSFGLLTLISGCADPSGSSSTPDIPVVTYDAGTYCDEYTQRLRACDLLGEGRFQGCHNFQDDAETCELQCLEDAPCEQLSVYYCGRSGSAITELEACLLTCVGDSAVECDEGTLHASYARCDGEADCADGTDEADCDDPNAARYPCRDGKFVDVAAVCDGEPDCKSGVDEAFCDTLFACEPAVLGGPSLIFIHATEACDGVSDCLSEADEPSDCAKATCE
jgi:Low-density lipoprotein receptor domain class A